MSPSAPPNNDNKLSPTSSASSTKTFVEQSSANSPAQTNMSNQAGPSKASKAASSPAPANRQPQDGAPLQRTVTSSSVHANNSLRRMATHETGEFVCNDRDGADKLHPHDEEHEGSDHEHSHGSTTSETLTPGEEEANVGMQPAQTEIVVDEKGRTKSKKKKEVELQDQTNLLPLRQVMLVFTGLTCALFCSLLDQTIVTTALPTLGRIFNRADISAWVGTAYLLTSTAMQPIYGRLSDIFGRKFVLLGSLTIFLLGSLACSLAQSMIQLIVFRAIQGIGGGGILTLAMIIISDVVSLKDRGKYQGVTGCVVALSNSLGPLLGGVFTEKASWRWCFYINLPLSACSIIIVILILPLKRVHGSMSDKLKKLDWYGSFLTLAWAVLVLLALSWAGSQHAWTSAAVLAPLFIGLALLGVFLYIEAKVVPLPLVPMRIFKTSTASAAMATSLCNGAIFYSTLYYLPTYYQVVKGVSAIRSGVLLLPLVLTQTVTSFVTGFIQSKTGDYWYNLVMGFTIWTIGVGLLSTIDVDTSTAKLVGYQFLDGIGAGQTFQTSLMAIQASVGRKDMATATGLRNFLRMLGGTLGLAVASVLVNNIVRSNLSGVVPENVLDAVVSAPTSANDLGLSSQEMDAVLHAYARAIQACFWFMIPLSGISLLLVVFFCKQVSLKRDDDAARKAEGKAWVESKKAKRRAKKMHQPLPTEQDGTTPVDKEDEGEPTVLGKLEQGLEEAGRGEDEAAGVEPAADEASIEGPVGSRP